MVVKVSSFDVDLLALPPWITVVYDDLKRTWQRTNHPAKWIAKI